VIPTVIDGGGIFGLDPVVHVIYVLVAAVTAQAIPSITTETAPDDEPKPDPVKVRTVFPVTEPYLGLIESIFGVALPSYATLLVRAV